MPKFNIVYSVTTVYEEEINHDSLEDIQAIFDAPEVELHDEYIINQYDLRVHSIEEVEEALSEHN